MNNILWTVAVTKDGKVYLEDNDFTHTIKLYVEGPFASDQEHWQYAGVIARKLNGTWTE
jgi:hypothetical protein